MSKIIHKFKSNKDLMALCRGNSFGDQIIIVVDVSKETPESQLTLHPCIAGEIVGYCVNHEGFHIEFTENAVLENVGLE